MTDTNSLIPVGTLVRVFGGDSSGETRIVKGYVTMPHQDGVFYDITPGESGHHYVRPSMVRTFE